MRKTNTKSTHLQCAWAKNTAPAKTGRAPARRSGARGIRSTKAEHGQTENRREETQRAPVHGWETESHPKRKHQHVQQPQHSEQQPQRQQTQRPRGNGTQAPTDTRAPTDTQVPKNTEAPAGTTRPTHASPAGTQTPKPAETRSQPQQQRQPSRELVNESGGSPQAKLALVPRDRPSPQRPGRGHL